MFRAALIISFAFTVFASYGLSQDPLPVIKSGWQPSVQKGKKTDTPQTGPARQLMAEDTIGPRTSREFRTDHPDNPSDQSPDGRRSVIEKNEQEANTPQPADVKGFDYSATVRNDSPKTVKVVYWEYKFTDKNDAKNSIRRQFLCAVNIKKGAEFELRAFSSLGPTDTVSAKTGEQKDNPFNETVRINRIEYSDDDILQRGDWKLADVKAGVERATSTPWNKEVCRPLFP